MRYAGHEPAPGGSRAGRGSRSPWGHADGPGRMAPRQGPHLARQSHAGAAASPSARVEPGREHLAISARQLVIEPRVHLLPGHRRSLLRRLEPPHRPTLAHHVHRPPGLGQCMMITVGWYTSTHASGVSNYKTNAWQSHMARREGYASLDPSVRSRFLPQKLSQYFPERMILHWNYSSAIALAVGAVCGPLGLGQYRSELRAVCTSLHTARVVAHHRHWHPGYVLMSASIDELLFQHLEIERSRRSQVSASFRPPVRTRAVEP